MDLTKLNSPTYSSVRGRFTYNCGGFALGTFDWYIPAVWYEYVDQPLSENEAYGDALEDMAQNILEDNPHLIRVNDEEILKRLPKRFDIIGFRIGVQPYCYWDDCEEEWVEAGDEGVELDDFHFIRRHDGVWYQKNGASSIYKMSRRHMKERVTRAGFEVDGFWGDRYDSNTVWFVDTRRTENPYLYEELPFAVWEKELADDDAQIKKWEAQKAQQKKQVAIVPAGFYSPLIAG